jgi:hypothetical protein
VIWRGEGVIGVPVGWSIELIELVLDDYLTSVPPLSSPVGPTVNERRLPSPLANGFGANHALWLTSAPFDHSR